MRGIERERERERERRRRRLGERERERREKREKREEIKSLIRIRSTMVSFWLLEAHTLHATEGGGQISPHTDGQG